MSYACVTTNLQARSERVVLQVMMVLMHNCREVPAEWQIKAPGDAVAAADWAYFKCEPEEGLLPPGQKQLLKVSHAYLCLHTSFGCTEALFLEWCVFCRNRICSTP